MECKTSQGQKARKHSNKQQMEEYWERKLQRGIDGEHGCPFIHPQFLRSHVRSITRWQPCVSTSLMSKCYIKKRKTRKKWVTEFPGIPFNLICRPDAPFPPLMSLPRHLRPPESALLQISRPKTNIQGLLPHIEIVKFKKIYWYDARGTQRATGSKMSLT